jgi:hypothetical protein
MENTGLKVYEERLLLLIVHFQPESFRAGNLLRISLSAEIQETKLFCSATGTELLLLSLLILL